MNSEQLQMKLKVPEDCLSKDSAIKEFIANRLTESTAGEVHLMESICAVGNRREARRRVMANRGAPGVDGVKFRELPGVLDRCWRGIRRSLLMGTYQPLPVRRKSIDKPGGGSRDLGIPTVQDRFVQQAMSQVLNAIYDHTFSDSSFGYRPGRSQAQAIEQVRKYVGSKTKFVVSIDLSKFFDRVNHDRLMSRLSKRVKDKRVLKLIRAFLNSGIELNQNETIYPGEGTPQGGPLSPLLSNIVLDEFDKELETRGLRFVRYADDIVIFARSRKAGERILRSTTKFLRQRMKLQVNEEKSGIVSPEEMKFLGFSINSKGWIAHINISQQSLERFKDKIRAITNRRRGISLFRMIDELNQYTRGWCNYFRAGLKVMLKKQLNPWIVRRLRAILWKQWKLPRTKVGNLMKLGIWRSSAIRSGCSRKGIWLMSRHPDVVIALPKKRFIQQYGFIPL